METLKKIFRKFFCWRTSSNNIFLTDHDDSVESPLVIDAGTQFLLENDDRQSLVEEWESVDFGISISSQQNDFAASRISNFNGRLVFAGTMPMGTKLSLVSESLDDDGLNQGDGLSLVEGWESVDFGISISSQQNDFAASRISNFNGRLVFAGTMPMGTKLTAIAESSDDDGLNHVDDELSPVARRESFDFGISISSQQNDFAASPISNFNGRLVFAGTMPMGTKLNAITESSDDDGLSLAEK